MIQPEFLTGDAGNEWPFEDQSVGGVFFSPPYSANMPYIGYDDNLGWTEYKALMLAIFQESLRVLVPGGRLGLNIANVIKVKDSTKSWVEFAADAASEWAKECGLLLRERITWQKYADPAEAPSLGTAWGSWQSASNPVLRATTEPVIIFSKKSYGRPDKGISDITAEEFKAWTRNSWLIPVTGTAQYRKKNPAMFPLELPTRFIKLYTYVGDTVFDPVGGLGTTAIAAALNNRRGVSMDIVPEQAIWAQERWDNDIIGTLAL